MTQFLIATRKSKMALAQANHVADLLREAVPGLDVDLAENNPRGDRDQISKLDRHGGKGGAPFPVPTAVYDETIETLRGAVERAKLGQTDKAKALRSLTRLAQKLEDGYTPRPFFDEAVERERRDSWKHGGRTVQGAAMPPDSGDRQRGQLDLFGSG